ncbi:MAG TPA: DNA mismatch repair protein MutT [Ruminococcus sp.]|nr:DNA mismatch repair protein MutT [Ruminococcus sp.]
MEYWDIYDIHKQRTGRTMQRNDFTMADGDYHLTVLGVIRRPDGKFLITQRALDKHWAPGWWEVSGGGVMAGETSREAVLREVREETGLDVSACESRLALTYHRENPGKGDNYFVDVYLFHMDFEEKDVRIQEAEATDFRIADAKEIKALADEGIFLHYDSIKQVFY